MVLPWESIPRPVGLILANGNIRTLDPARPRASAVAFACGRVAALDDDALALRTPRTEVVDLRGRTVIPGLVDHHVHFTAFAASLDRVNLEGARSVEECVARVAARVAAAPPGEWIVGRGWNHLDWTPPAFPHRQAMDAVAPNNPVALDRKDGHSMWVNSAALRAVNITRDTPDPEGGVIDRDGAGDPTGILRDNAMERIGCRRGDDDLSEEALIRAVREANRLGLTAVHNLEDAASLRLFQRLRAREALTLRVTHMIPACNLEHALALGLRGGLGDECLRIGGVKMFADGSLGSLTAWMLEAFEGQPGKCGIATASMESIERCARLAAGLGMMVCTHAIGDRANREVLNVYEALRRAGVTAPLRIEHAQHLHRDDVGRFARSNVIASMQPIHCTSDYRMTDALLGERGRSAYAFKSLLDSGATLVFGSDCPVETLDPWAGIHAAVTRERADGTPPGGWHPEERLSVEQAVRAYGGRLAAGGAGDCLVLSHDLFEVPARAILETRVEGTVVAGRIVAWTP